MVSIGIDIDLLLGEMLQLGLWDEGEEGVDLKRHDPRCRM